jgi:hypothetical protein
MDKYALRAKLLSKYFGIYGYGNFDISEEELTHILQLVEEGEEEPLRNAYERLYKLRMG